MDSRLEFVIFLKVPASAIHDLIAGINLEVRLINEMTEMCMREVEIVDFFKNISAHSAESSRHTTRLHDERC